MDAEIPFIRLFKDDVDSIFDTLVSNIDCDMIDFYCNDSTAIETGLDFYTGLASMHINQSLGDQPESGFTVENSARHCTWALEPNSSANFSDISAAHGRTAEMKERENVNLIDPVSMSNKDLVVQHPTIVARHSSPLCFSDKETSFTPLLSNYPLEFSKFKIFVAYRISNANKIPKQIRDKVSPPCQPSIDITPRKEVKFVIPPKPPDFCVLGDL